MEISILGAFENRHPVGVNACNISLHRRIASEMTL